MNVMQNYKRLYDIEKINEILKVRACDLQIHKSDEGIRWLTFFFNSMNPYERGTKERTLCREKAFDFLKLEKDQSEELFKEWFPELIYDKYVHPYKMENPVTQVKPEKIKRAAAELYEMNFNGTVTLEELEKIVKYIYMGTTPASKKFWNYDGLMLRCGFGTEFHTELWTDEICCKVRDRLLSNTRLAS